MNNSEITREITLAVSPYPWAWFWWPLIERERTCWPRVTAFGFLFIYVRVKTWVS